MKNCTQSHPRLLSYSNYKEFFTVESEFDSPKQNFMQKTHPKHSWEVSRFFQTETPTRHCSLISQGHCLLREILFLIDAETLMILQHFEDDAYPVHFYPKLPNMRIFVYLCSFYLSFSVLYDLKASST